jgi:hypothetical protein
MRRAQLEHAERRPALTPAVTSRLT